MNTNQNIDRMLLMGARSNDVGAVRQAITEGADMYYRDAAAVSMGVKTNNPEMLKVFLDAGFDINYMAEVVFLWVVRQNNLKMFQMLCDLSLPPVTIAGAVLATSNHEMIDFYNQKTGLAFVK